MNHSSLVDLLLAIICCAAIIGIALLGAILRELRKIKQAFQAIGTDTANTFTPPIKGLPAS